MYDNVEYEKIDDRKYYCGNANFEDVQDDYDLEGNLPYCFRTGVGVGLSKSAIKRREEQVGGGEEEEDEDEENEDEEEEDE
jgi:hypothetical protein